MSNDKTSPPSPSFGERLGMAFMAFLKALIRLLAILIMAVILGILLFYAVPLLYRTYIQPIQTSITHLQDAQALQDQTNQQMLQRLSDVQGRIDGLEVQADTDKQTINELQTSLDGAASTQQAGLDQIKSTQAAVDARITKLTSELASLDQKRANLENALNQNTDHLQALATQIRSEDAPVETLRRELQLVKAMELLTRSRLFLIGNNIGLAQQDIQSAQALLQSLQQSVLPFQTDALSAIISRLNLALENLPDAPILAADDLEIAWQLLEKGLPGEPTLASFPTGTPTPTIEITLTLTTTQTTLFTPITVTPASATPSPTPTKTAIITRTPTVLPATLTPTP
jgi:hypothetical protein